MTRFARDRRVFFVEEPVFGADADRIDVRAITPTLSVVTPQLEGHPVGDDLTGRLRQAVDHIVRAFSIRDFVAWYWTPMALPFTRHLAPAVTVFDCMDELSAFAGAPPELRRLERELLQRADIVFTGGQSLFEAKMTQHHNVRLFPSSVDVAHFAQARTIASEPADQRDIPHPRLGYFGVIDERMDLPLLAGVAARRPDWHLVMLGPTAKVDPAQLPSAPNIHYLGMKPYDLLPAYLAGWDVALLPFARNDATRFISPTKTPEYLAAGRPVVSTSIRDVVRPYGSNGLVHIADTPDAFVAACEAALAEDAADRLERVDRFLAGVSWDVTHAGMDALIRNVPVAPRAASARSVGASPSPSPLFVGAPNVIQPI